MTNLYHIKCGEIDCFQEGNTVLGAVKSVINNHRWQKPTRKIKFRKVYRTLHNNQFKLVYGVWTEKIYKALKDIKEEE